MNEAGPQVCLDVWALVIGAAGRIEPARVDDLLACLYGLHAVLSLHFTQEEESYFALADTHPPPTPDSDL